MPRKLALLIGNSDYQDTRLPRLNAPDDDVEALAEVLKAPEIGGFDDVISLLNQSEGATSRAIVRFFRNAQSKDLLLLYFSGHGILGSNGQLYLAAPDTEHDVLEASAIPTRFVRERMDDSMAKRQVLILDCCNSGAIARAKVSLGSSIGTQDALGGQGRVILTASDALEVALDGQHGPGGTTQSIFTHYLIEGLKTGQADTDGDGMISAGELYTYTYDGVMADQRTQQHPLKLGEEAGHLIIARAARSSGLPASLLEDLSSQVKHRRRGAVRELGSYLDGDDEALAALALEHLLRIATSARNPLDLRKLAVTQLTGALLAESPRRGSALREAIEQLAKSESQPVAEMAVAALEKVNELGQPAVVNPPQTMRAKPSTFTLREPLEIEFVRIPAGEFLMGSQPEGDPLAFSREQPQHSLHLDAFYMGKYPVTVAQWQTFIQLSGHTVSTKKSLEGDPDHPVAWVNWHDARAFCRWMSAESGYRVYLPSEAEWEKAARGTDGRVYPWGNDWQPDKANINEARFGGVVAVGRHSPEGDSPWGVADVCGNVWEWTRSIFGRWDRGQRRHSKFFRYPYDAGDGREDTGAGDEASRVVRGGAFVSSRRDARLTSRFWNLPPYRNSYLGFRVALQLPDVGE